MFMASVNEASREVVFLTSKIQSSFTVVMPLNLIPAGMSKKSIHTKIFLRQVKIWCTNSFDPELQHEARYRCLKFDVYTGKIGGV